MKTIGILANCDKPSAPQILRNVAENAQAIGFHLIAAEPTAALLPAAECVTTDELVRRSEVLMVLGGDGTMLHAVRLLGSRQTPVLGVNLGSLGFLTSVTQDDITRAMDCIARNDFTTSARAIMDCTVRRDGREIGRHHALNDVVLDRGGSTRIITMTVRIDGEPISTCMADGLIVSTPTGSTGHALSAGGPVLHPATNAFEITLICPHTLSIRPLVVSDTSTISVHVTKCTGTIMLSIDGQSSEQLQPADEVEVRKSPAYARFIHLPGYSYFSVLRQKLHWRGSTM